MLFHLHLDIRKAVAAEPQDASNANIYCLLAKVILQTRLFFMEKDKGKTVSLRKITDHTDFALMSV